MNVRGWKAILVTEIAICLYLFGLFYFYLVHIWR